MAAWVLARTIRVDRKSFTIEAQGAYVVTLKDMQGRETFRAQGEGRREFLFAPDRADRSGLRFLTVASAAGSRTYKLVDY